MSKNSDTRYVSLEYSKSIMSILSIYKSTISRLIILVSLISSSNIHETCEMFE